MRRVLPILWLCAGPAIAQTCPEPPDISAQADPLHARLAAAPDPATTQRIGGALWELWLTAPDEASQELLDEGIGRMRSGDLSGSISTLGRLTYYCPDYAEGWNQRAFAKFLGGDYEGALDDLDRAVALSPRHVGAVSGRGLTLFRLGREEEGKEAIREAVRLNPWLAERTLIEAPGEDI